MIRKQLICYLLMTLLVVPLAWSQERAIRPANQQSNADVRQALVIGNSAYISAGMLRNPVNDARAISSTLSQLGFEVTMITNADQRKMEQSIRDFGRELRDQKGVGLFYYAGHGMQFDGENYLLPVDINPSTEEDVRYDAVPVGKLLAQMRAADNKMNVVILDACRNNPFSRSFRTFNPGLAQVNAAAGTFISFATAPGQIAADGEGSNGLFTSKLLQHLRTPGLKIEEVFKRTTADVYLASNKRQAPWVQYSVIGDFFFVPKGNPPQVPNKTTLSDLQNRANAEQAARLEQQRLEAQWKEWQQKMQEDYERVLVFEKQAVGKELKIESWERFLSNWADDNPYSQQDTELRSGAQAKLSFWRNVQKVEPKSNLGIEVVLSGEDAKKKLLETRKCSGCNLSWTNLRGAYLSGAHLKEANLMYTNLSGANLEDAKLYKANLEEANLRYADLHNADLYKANLRGAYLSGAHLEGANLNGAYLKNAKGFQNMNFVKFCETTMPDGSINNSDC
jgi:uncharacterized caspase-like protein